MQKFTRALTREVEIGGERLALTLDENGVTVRPVGSRRPPATLTWSAVVCAAAGTQDVAEAVAALKDGKASAAPASPSTVTPVKDTPLTRALVRLEEALKKHRPRFAAGLLPGAAAEDVAKLEKAIGRTVPDEGRQWLTWHNGQSDEEIGAFYEAFNLLSAEEIVESYKEQQDEGDPKWNAAWIPLLDDYQGDVIVVDSASEGGPVREVWRGREEHEVTAPSLLAWVEALTSDIEAGRFQEDPERGEYHRITQGQ